MRMDVCVCEREREERKMRMCVYNVLIDSTLGGSATTYSPATTLV